jgi:hypothetical protein
LRRSRLIKLATVASVVAVCAVAPSGASAYRTVADLPAWCQTSALPSNGYALRVLAGQQLQVPPVDKILYNRAWPIVSGLGVRGCVYDTLPGTVLTYGWDVRIERSPKRSGMTCGLGYDPLASWETYKFPMDAISHLGYTQGNYEALETTLPGNLVTYCYRWVFIGPSGEHDPMPWNPSTLKFMTYYLG